MDHIQQITGDVLREMGEIVYITVQTPFGKAEAFVLNEISALRQLGVNVLVVPRSPKSEVFHESASKAIIEHTLSIPLAGVRTFVGSLLFLVTNPLSGPAMILRVIRKSKRPGTIARNLTVLPKALCLTRIIKKRNISHIHVHWGTTTATIAYIVAKLADISWSLTVHRWDIGANNMLPAKAESARFIRCISEHGKNMLLEIIGEKYRDKVLVIHMGVDCDIAAQTSLEKKEDSTIALPANLYPVKGHKYLIDACSILRDENRKYRCYFYGEGFLRKELENYIEQKRLGDFIEMPGMVPHGKLMEMYRTGQIDAVVLPSINTEDGAHEGIPVSLMEAMSYGIPVVSTDTGGIPELIGDGSGIMVKEKDSEAIAQAIRRLMLDENYRKQVGERGKSKIASDFNITKNAKELLSGFLSK